MNKKFFLLIIILLILVINPRIALNGATDGLLLWFQVIVPTILPFMIISHLIQNVYGSSISNPILYTAIIGLLCGFPMGAFAVSSMYKQQRLSEKNAYLLLACCNISSPSFVISYIAMTNLGLGTFPYIYLIMNYLPVFLILIYVIMFSDYKKYSLHIEQITNNTILNYDAFDNAVTGSILNILKLGAFIIIFSIIGAFIELIPLKSQFTKCLLLGFAEITTGINYACSGVISAKMMLPATLIINAFGGLSCMFQSNIFLKQGNLSIKKYMYSKILLTIITIIVWYLLVHVLKISIK